MKHINKQTKGNLNIYFACIGLYKLLFKTNK